MKKSVFIITALLVPLIVILAGNAYKVSIEIDLMKPFFDMFYWFLFSTVGISTAFFLLFGIFIPAILIIITTPSRTRRGRAHIPGHGICDVEVEEPGSLEDSPLNNNFFAKITISVYPIIVLFFIFLNFVLFVSKILKTDIYFVYPTGSLNFLLILILLIPSILFGIVIRRKERPRKLFNGFSGGLVVGSLFLIIAHKVGVVDSFFEEIARQDFAIFLSFYNDVISAAGI